MQSRKYALKKAVVVIRSNHQYTNSNDFLRMQDLPKPHLNISSGL